MTINKILAARQELSEREIVAIEEVQRHLGVFLKRPTFYTPEEDCSEVVTAFEFVLQKLWGFPIDKKFHRYQNDLKGCLCDTKMDNMERVGATSSRVYNKECPFHGIT